MLTTDDLKSSWILFTDGACSGNPGPGGWGSILVHPDGEVVELGGHANAVTNNQMELRAVIEGIKLASREDRKLFVFTDSTYVIRGATQWVWGWRARGWKSSTNEPVQNKEYWIELMRVIAKYKKGDLVWRYCRGHKGTPGNERCDEIAVAFSKKRFTPLYRGPLINYSVAIHDIPEEEALPEMKPKVEKVAAFSYLSLLGGKLQRHQTWADCEKRVKGQSGAKFKKAMSEKDEADIIDLWGLTGKVKWEGD